MVAEVRAVSTLVKTFWFLRSGGSHVGVTLIAGRASAAGARRPTSPDDVGAGSGEGVTPVVEPIGGCTARGRVATTALTATTAATTAAAMATARTAWVR